MTSFPAFTLLFVQKYFCLYNEKEITRRLEDMNFIFPFAAFFREILFLPLENNIYSFAPLCYILYISSRSQTLHSEFREFMHGHYLPCSQVTDVTNWSWVLGLFETL